MSDLIRVVDFEVWTRIGVPDAERAEAQRLLITLEMRVDGFAVAAASDDIAKTINYFEATEYVKTFAAEMPRKLLETFAENLAADLLRKFPIQQLGLEVKKFILPEAEYVSVRIERGKNN